MTDAMTSVHGFWIALKLDVALAVAPRVDTSNEPNDVVVERCRNRRICLSEEQQRAPAWHLSSDGISKWPTTQPGSLFRMFDEEYGDIAHDWLEAEGGREAVNFGMKMIGAKDVYDEWDAQATPAFDVFSDVPIWKHLEAGSRLS
ncbi:uncharacterized protein BT62DRAFT_1011143 [Guyanagaster necrorhizus]|uniref:Uncharacterized protein n=1 Tax=Guyanagaster necrorhizus TaxID=856835 RepID=A0A9P7VKW0_9AGAR|nr:uncharacterized protein BT62DRAFT_1011143 [Guyanagaster necrorhizus MCA 3950]KAG7441836.1 hypothetical protein BT62DRAFT_1011143 [Guyanagaster necrorhizus MCA 3950]